MRVLLFLAGIAVAFGVPFEAPKNFTNYKLFAAKLASLENIEIAHKLERDGLLDLWTHTPTKEGSIFFSAAPEDVATIQGHFKASKSVLTTLEENLQKVIDEQTSANTYEPVTKRRIKFTQFETYEQILASLDYYVEVAKGTAGIITTGTSVNGRKIQGIKITTSFAELPIIFMECGIHAREWASTSTCLYIIDQLIENSKEHQDLLDKYEFHIIPSSNPDGYEYTHHNNRLWRKNRSKNGRCYGVDVNRNFGTGGHCRIGASTDPCDETFCGTAAFSEPETRAIRDYVSKIASRVEYYISLHSFGLMWMYPYSYTEILCADNNDLHRRTKIGVDAIRASTGTEYKYGPIATTIYSVSGSSIDWAYDDMKIKKPFALELQPGNAFNIGARGFLLSPTKIIFVGKETFTGLSALWLS